MCLYKLCSCMGQTYLEALLVEEEEKGEEERGILGDCFLLSLLLVPHLSSSLGHGRALSGGREML